jgi:hypothetical protein
LGENREVLAVTPRGGSLAVMAGVGWSRAQTVGLVGDTRSSLLTAVGFN